MVREHHGQAEGDVHRARSNGAQVQAHPRNSSVQRGEEARIAQSLRTIHHRSNVTSRRLKFITDSVICRDSVVHSIV